MKPIQFRCSSIPVIPFEDDEVNPGVLGRGLADWVKTSLEDSPYSISEDIPEDWGYCLMVHRKPYWLWVGCGGRSEFDYPENGLTPEIASSFPRDTITWSLWVATEWGWVSRLLGRDDRKRESRRLQGYLESKVKALADVTIL